MLFSANTSDFPEKSGQIVWEIQFTIIITICGRNYSIFARSYLGYGRDQARERYLAFIAQKTNCYKNSDCVVKSPCLNKGFKESLAFDDEGNI